MQGRKRVQWQFLAMVDINARIPQRHPIREIKRLSDEVFRRLAEHFEAMYSEIDRPSIPRSGYWAPGFWRRTFSVPSDPAFCERLHYDLLFQWFLDLELNEAPFDASSFSRNQQRLLEHQVADKLVSEVVGLLPERKLLSDEHFWSTGL